MKLPGIHVYLIPVIIIVSLCAYVYFLSKDILTLDREVRTLKSVVARLQPQGSSQCTPQPTPIVVPVNGPETAVSVSPEIVPVPVEDISEDIPEEETPVIYEETLAEITPIPEEDSPVTDEETPGEITPAPLEETPVPTHVPTQDTSQVPNQIPNVVPTPITLDIEDTDSVDSEKVQAMMKGIEEFEIVSPKPEYTIMELRNMCKEKGVSGKGSKVELKQRLGL